MMTQTYLALSLGFAGLILATEASFAAAPQCAQRASVLQQLAEKYGESRRSVGIAANNTVIETFASETGSWTITVTMPNGRTCLIAAGQAFETLAEQLPAQGAPV